MGFRVATLNLEQDHKRWQARLELIAQQLGELKPDIFALNEICIPRQTGRWLQRVARERFGIQYTLLQQSKTGASSQVEGEGLLTCYPVVEAANFDFRAIDSVALVARLDVAGREIDVYVTHLYRSRGEDALRQYQVQQLLGWTRARGDVEFSVVCGDFNATLEMASGRLMADAFRPTQTEPTAFTPLQEPGGAPSHPYWERFDRCIDFVWVTDSLQVQSSGLCFNSPARDDPTLWPSDHLGVWADLEFG